MLHLGYLGPGRLHHDQPHLARGKLPFDLSLFHHNATAADAREGWQVASFYVSIFRMSLAANGKAVDHRCVLGRESLIRSGFDPFLPPLCRSHIWSTGQDANATIKRQLQRLLLGISVFLE